MKKVKGIKNYYGSLWILKEGDRFYWIMENHDTDLSDLSEWIEIPISLYNELILQTE